MPTFFSFGTNDLTQMTFGYSRDDAEGGFLLKYVEHGILPENPFQTLDDAVAGLMRIAVDKGRATRPDLKLGICGEHGGDPASIANCRGRARLRVLLAFPRAGSPPRRGAGRPRESCSAQTSSRASSWSYRSAAACPRPRPIPRRSPPRSAANSASGTPACRRNPEGESEERFLAVYGCVNRFTVPGDGWWLPGMVAGAARCQ